MTVTNAAATSVRAAAVRVDPAVRVPSATARGRLAIVPTVRRVARARTVIVLTVIVLMVTAPRVIARKASASGRGVISAIVRRVIVLKVTVLRVIVRRATVRARSAIVRMARRAATARKAIVPRVTAPVRTAAPAASVAGVVQPS